MMFRNGNFQINQLDCGTKRILDPNIHFGLNTLLRSIVASVSTGPENYFSWNVTIQRLVPFLQIKFVLFVTV